MRESDQITPTLNPMVLETARNAADLKPVEYEPPGLSEEEQVEDSLISRPFQKGPLCGKFVGSGTFSDHVNIRRNFYKIVFSSKCFEMFKLDPLFFATLH